jgi:hypothetical protein
MHRHLALAFAAAFLATPALADDSSAALGMGGVVLTQNADIRMASEDLSLSPKAVHVRYEFVNDSDKDVDTIVAFPLPDIDLWEFSESPVGSIVDKSPNFVGFELTVDGRRVEATPEEHALLNGRDVTAEVHAAGLPVNFAGTNLFDRLSKLSPAVRQSLSKEGLVELEDTDAHAKWTATTKFWWRQHFPAHRTVVIEHSYQPVTGQFFFVPESLTDNDPTDRNAQTFCIDAPTKAAIQAKLAKARLPGNAESMLNGYETDFVIKTANNWKGPIGHFRLTIDKLKPDNIVSLCWDGDLRKTGATTFEATRENFAPQHDIKLLVLETPAQQ